MRKIRKIVYRKIRKIVYRSETGSWWIMEKNPSTSIFPGWQSVSCWRTRAIARQMLRNLRQKDAEYALFRESEAKKEGTT